MFSEGKFECTAGIVDTPEKGSVVIPPEKTGRKDIEVGEMVIKTEPTSEREAKIVKDAKSKGITEVPVEKFEARDDER